jgi:hypothetical protein
MLQSEPSRDIFPVSIGKAMPGQRWWTFIKSHHEIITGMNFFHRHNGKLRILYCFLIRHDRREGVADASERNGPHDGELLQGKFGRFETASWSE